MGRVKDNLLTKGFSGRIGDEIVFRQMGNQTFFSKRPRKRETCTPNQKAYRSKFQQASYYARTVQIDPFQRAQYAKAAKQAGLNSAYAAALKDYLVDPKIVSINITGYGGNTSDAITFIALNDFKIIEAVVTIRNSDDAIIETGKALFSDRGWVYLIKQASTLLTANTITVTIKDRLGKTAVKSVSFGR